MKAHLVFLLPEDQYEYACAVNGAAYKEALDEIDERLFRQPLKYDDTLKKAKRALLEELRAEIREVVRKRLEIGSQQVDEKGRTK